MEIRSPASLRDQAEMLRRRSRELRHLSARVLRRRDHAVHRLELRRELLRSEFEQLRAQRRHARAPGDDDGLDEWMRGEVLQMLAAGWKPRELADVGIGTELLRELRLDEHPALCPPPPVKLAARALVRVTRPGKPPARGSGRRFCVG